MRLERSADADTVPADAVGRLSALVLKSTAAWGRNF